MQTKAPSAPQVAAAVCGTSSLARLSLLIRLMPCYPGCRPRPAFVNYSQPLGVRQYEMSRAGSSSNHATRLLQYGSSIKKGKKTNRKKNTGNQRNKRQQQKKEKGRQGKTTFEAAAPVCGTITGDHSYGTYGIRKNL